MTEEARIASIADENARQEAIRLTAQVEAKRLADLAELQKKAQIAADKLAAEKVLESKLAAEAEAVRLKKEQAIADALAAKKKSRRSRAS